MNGESIFPGLEEDDPLKRETQRLAGSAYFDLLMLQGITPSARVFGVVSDSSIGTWRDEAGGSVDIYRSIVAPDDGTYISQGIGGLGSNYSANLASMTIRAGSRITIRFRARQVLTGGPLDNSFFAYFTQGANTVDSGPITTIGATFAEYTASAVAVADVTGAPFIQFGGAGFSGHSYYQVSWARVEVTP